MKKDFTQELPLSEAVFLILLSLAEGPKHGYAIMKDVHELSAQRVSLSTGTLYGALKRLLKQEVSWAGIKPVPSEGHSGTGRQPIRLVELDGVLQEG